jgi:hypothetical protein
MPKQTCNTVDRERGAVLIHVAFALLALLAFTTFVVDYGVLWVARRQAQNSADAGALAGAIAAAYDDPNDLTDTGPAKQNAYAATQNNIVFGQPPSVVISSDITFPTCPDGYGRCIRVDTYRTVARGNALPMFFGQLVGLNSQDVRAMAMAQIVPGNTSECLKPWAVPDKWDERQTPVWDETDTFDRYDRDFNVIPNPDVYIPPDANGPGTGFNLTDDLYRRFVLKVGNPQQAIRPGWFFPVALAANPGGDEYRDAIAGCIGVPYSIGDFMPVEPGNMIGPTKQGVDDLIAMDPNASWGDTGVSGGCMASGSCTLSPRVVAIPVFDLDVYYQGKTGGRIDIKIVNILGFFIEQMSGNDVVGYLMTHPSLYTAGRDTVSDESAFSKTIMLIR